MRHVRAGRETRPHPRSLPRRERVDLHLDAAVSRVTTGDEVEAMTELAGGDDDRGGATREPFDAIHRDGHRSSAGASPEAFRRDAEHDHVARQAVVLDAQRIESHLHARVAGGLGADRPRQVGASRRSKTDQRTGPVRSRTCERNVVARYFEVGRGRRGRAPLLARLDHVRIRPWTC